MTMQNRFIAKLPDGSVYAYSYDRIIGFWSPRIADRHRGIVFTDEKISATTNRHRKQFLGEHGGSIVDAAGFQKLLLVERDALRDATKNQRNAEAHELHLYELSQANLHLELDNDSLRRQIRDLKALVELSLDEQG